MIRQTVLGRLLLSGVLACWLGTVGCKPAAPARTEIKTEQPSADDHGHGQEQQQPAATAEGSTESHDAEVAELQPVDEGSSEQTTPDVVEPSEPVAVAETPAEEEAPGNEETPVEEEPAPAADNSQPVDDSQPAGAVQQTPAVELVVLGETDLTSGIPGEGPLTMEQIQAWLADQKNMAVLEVSLPLGLSAGTRQIKGLDQNPLTRAKIELGRQLYFDTRLSADNTVSCASCHHPDEGYAKHTQFGVGINEQEGNRNSPTSYNRILSDKQFWDGRAESLEAQAIGPIANPIEMGNTHEKAVETLAGIEGYRLQFETIFPDGVTIENVGQAIAAFERVIVTGPAPFDYYEVVRAFESQLDEEDLAEMKEDNPEKYAEYQQALEGSQEMSESARRGHELFFSDKANCTACHVGANLTDEKYHNLGVGMDVAEPDLGRFAETNEEKDRGAFKTPTIRNVALTAPYMHDGSQKTLKEVVDWYVQGGHPNPHLSDKIKKLDLTDQDKEDLVALMEACTGPFPQVEQARLPE